MKIRELKLQSGSAIASAWPPMWAGWGGGPCPLGTQGTIVRVEWGEDQRSLVFTNRYADGEHTGTLIVEDPERMLPRVMQALEDRLPLSAQDIGELDLPLREASYGRYTIEAVSYRGRPEGKPWGWVAKALVVWDESGATHHQQLLDARARLFETREEADLLAFQLGRAWIDENR